MHAYPLISAAIAFTALAVLILLIRWALKDRRRSAAEEPHACPDGVWMPVVRTYSMKVGEREPIQVALMEPNGMLSCMSVPVSFGAVICKGVFCSSCGIRLRCAVCRTTPTAEIVLESEEERAALLACCREPRFADAGERCQSA